MPLPTLRWGEVDPSASLRRIGGRHGRRRITVAALESLGADDLGRTVTIRGEPHTVVQAIQRNLTHLAYHTGQIVQLARHFAGDGWRTLSIPPGESEAYNARQREKWEAGRRAGKRRAS